MEKGITIPQNKFEVLKSRVMQCGEKKRTIERVRVVEVECYKCGEREHKYKEYLLWERKERVAHAAKPQEVHQQRELVCSVKKKHRKEKEN